ncbi:MAG: hypothetical protein WD470_11130 [Rhodospirillaceae bacterium]
MTRKFGLVAAFAASLTAFAATPPAAQAQSGEEFFRGKTITIMVGLSAGGSYDYYARFLSEFYGKHIPGNPTVLVQNRGGAGSRTAANFAYTAAPKDGTVMAMTLDTLPLYQALRGKGVRFDLNQVQWVGNMANLTAAVVVWHTSPVTTVEGLSVKEAVFGSTGTSSGTYMIPTLMNGILGTKIKVVSGFPGTNQINLAMERGEVHGRAGGSWANFRIQKADWLRDRKVIPLVQIGLTKAPDLADVPLITDLAKTDDQRKLMNLLSSASTFSRALWLPPEVPAAQVEILRRAFEATMKDPEFLAEAEKRSILIDPMTGDVLKREIGKALDLPTALVDEARQVLGME